ncbi:MAG TPA: hypothetical protein VET89_05485 [Stellaceae bacterium]|nr:hypothetical protein [Stellaceae bacterium]
MAVVTGGSVDLDGFAARIATLAERVNGDAALLRRGRFLTTVLQLLVGEEFFLVRIVDGRIAETRRGGLTTGDFAMIAEPSVWHRLLATDPPPGDHDFLAFYKRKELRLAGDIHPLMAHLLYFKGVLAKLREDAR